MSNSFLDLTAGGVLPSTVFTMKPCWATRPSMEIQFGREVIQYDKSVLKYRNLTSNIGWKYTMGFTTIDKVEEHKLLTFFFQQKAMVNRFWCPVRSNYFILADDIATGSSNISIEPDDFLDIVKYTERLFILLKNGDWITRQFAGHMGPGDGDFRVVSPFDRDITPEDVDIMGKLILCRFDSDEIQLAHSTATQAEVALTVQELGQEYISEELP